MAPRYVALAQRMAQSIEAGVIRPGERLPSLRALCQEEGISLMTALAAYRRLEAAGWVEASARSGYRARPPLPGTPPASPVGVTRRVAHSALRDQLVEQVLTAVADPSLEPLGLGVPTPDRFPLETLRRRTASLLSASPGLWTVYSPPPGDPDLRRQVAQRLRQRGLDVDPSEVLVTCGASEALSLAMRVLLGPGDLLAVPCPTFFGILDAARSAGAQVLEFPEGPQGAGAEAFARACGREPVRAVALVPSFSNPTGLLLPPDAREAWAKTLVDRGVGLVEDDLYGELGFDGRRPTPILARMPREAGPPAFLVGGYSKTLVPGGRVGFLVARHPWIHRAAELKRASTLANVTLAERLVATCLETGLYDRHLRRMVPALHQGVEALRQEVLRTFPAGTRVSAPRGGFGVWVELPGENAGLRLFERAREAGISLAPGPIFSLGPGLERFVRLNAGATLKRADTVARLGALAANQLGF